MTEEQLIDLINNASEDELDQILAQMAISEDFPSYAKRLLKVQTPNAEVVQFALNGPQQILHRIVDEIISPNRLIRLVALKARRMGFSTYFSGRFFKSTSNKANHYAIQITHEPDATDFLFKMVKRFYNLIPKAFRPETLYNNARLLEFNNAEGTGLNSAFRVATAGKDDLGSGQLIHFAHLSETSKWAQHNIKSLLTSLLQCIPDKEGTEIVFESTAKGIGGEFYDRFWGSRFRVFIKKLDLSNIGGDPGRKLTAEEMVKCAVIEEQVNESASEDNIYTSVFLPWFCFEEYQLPVPEGFILTEKEEETRSKHGLTMGQMMWRRNAIANKCDGSIDIFNQEYPATARLAFVGSGRPVFDVMKLMHQMDAAPEPIARYELHAGNWAAVPVGRLKVWEEPKSGGDYIISADVAEGLVSGDCSSADVIDHRTGKQVAQWHGRIDQDNILEFADILFALGRRYNMALLAPERNNHGLGIVQNLYAMRYPRLYCEMVPDPPNKPRKRYGWVTSRSTRPLIIDNLIKEVTEGDHGIHCRETFDEMMSFKVQDNGKLEADTGCYDDRVISIAIAKYLRQTESLPSMRHMDQVDKFGRRKKSKRINPKAWT